MRVLVYFGALAFIKANNCTHLVDVSSTINIHWYPLGVVGNGPKRSIHLTSLSIRRSLDKACWFLVVDFVSVALRTFENIVSYELIPVK